MSKPNGFIIVCLLVAILIFFIIWAFSWFHSPAKEDLPSTARDIQEHYDTWYFPPDYFYLLKAKITASEFEDYKEKREFVPIPKDLKDEIHGMAFGDKDWWDVSPDLEGAFYSPDAFGSGVGAIMKYENGYVYYLEYSGY